ncbi:MAG: potassium translocating ATPase, subunit C [uncultured bacterium]|nr:MAG: potassium translocating ATPase, subunit C [uncultured bacterium]
MSQLKTAGILLILMTLLTGVFYPLLVTGIAQFFFPWQANGSLIEQDDRIVGSLLIGQSFTDPRYFWGRPSATTPFPYNAANSSGSNFGPLNSDFLKITEERIHYLQQFESLKNARVPVDLVTTSASGLDPEISPLAAYYQVPRIAKARHVNDSEIRAVIQNKIIPRTFYLLGEPRINVLQLNLALDNQLEGNNHVRQAAKARKVFEANPR